MKTALQVAAAALLLMFLAIGVQAGDERQVLLAMHKALLEAHKNANVTGLLAPEPDEIITVSRGEVSYSKKKERIARFEKYLGSTEFTKYRDKIEPVIRVSNDGSLGWVIVQVEIAGIQTDENGERVEFESLWGWIELYEKHDGKWLRVGTVSNRKPE